MLPLVGTQVQDAPSAGMPRLQIPHCTMLSVLDAPGAIHGSCGMLQALGTQVWDAHGVGMP